MKICPQCSKEFGEEYKFCPEDGTPLVQIVRTQDPLVGKTVNNKYEIINLVREDNLGRTFHARQQPLGRTVLLEIFNANLTQDDKFHSRLNEAIRRYSKLQHVNIGTIYDMDEMDDGRFFITSEYVEGRPLSEILESEAPIAQERAINLFYQIMDALQHAHANLIDHGYLTPKDIIIYTNPDGKECVQLLNFGISKLLLHEKIDKFFAEPEGGHLDVADVTYLSPEQVTAASSSDDLDDIYCFGVILYHALTGGPPFQAESAEAMLEAHTTIEPVPIRNLPHCKFLHATWDAIVEKCLKKKKGERFQSIKELKVMLQRISEYLSHEAEPTIMRMSTELGRELQKSRPATEAPAAEDAPPEETSAVPPPPPPSVRKKPPLAETFMIHRDEILDEPPAEEVADEMEDTRPPVAPLEEEAAEIQLEDLTESLPPEDTPQEEAEEEDQRTVMITMPRDEEDESIEDTGPIPIEEVTEGEGDLAGQTILMDVGPDEPEPPEETPPADVADEDLYEGKTVFIEDVASRTPAEEKDREFSLTEMIETPAAGGLDDAGEEDGIFGKTVLLTTPPDEEEPPPPADEPAPESDTAAWESPPLGETVQTPPPPPPTEPPPPLVVEPQAPIDLLNDEPFSVTAGEEISPEPPPAPPAAGQPPTAEYAPAGEYAPAPAEYAAPPAKSGKKTLVVVGIIAAVVIIGLLAAVGYFALQLLSPDKSTLTIKSYPEDAVVYLNGDEYGSTPFRHENIDPGEYTLELRKEGFAVLTKPITLEAGKALELRERLTRLGEPEPTEPLAEFSDELVDLQAKADDAFQRERLLEPPEDNAYYYTQQMLALDATNEYALNLQTQIVDTWKSKADAAFKAGNFYNAKKFYTQLLELQPENEEFKQALAQSEEKLQEFFAKKKQNLQQFQTRAEKLIWQGDLITPADENAYEICLQIRAMDRNNSFATKTMRDIRRKADNQIDNAILESKWARAQELLEAYNKYFPGDAAAFQKLEKVKENLAQARIEAQQQAREQQREQQLERARQTSQQGITAYKSGNYGNAIDLLQQALQINPDLSDAYFYLGASYLEMRDYAKARQYFQKAIEKDPNHKMAYLNLGILSQESKNYDRAIECLNKVILLGGAPNYPVSRLRETVNELNIRKGFSSLVNQSLAAEHKKFLGGTDGNAIFTEDSFRFETSEAKKGFDFPLSTMDNLKFTKGTELEFTAGGKKYTIEIKNTADYERLRRFLPDYLKLVK